VNTRARIGRKQPLPILRPTRLIVSLDDDRVGNCSTEFGETLPEGSVDSGAGRSAALTGTMSSNQKATRKPVIARGHRIDRNRVERWPAQVLEDYTQPGATGPGVARNEHEITAHDTARSILSARSSGKWSRAPARAKSGTSRLHGGIIRACLPYVPMVQETGPGMCIARATSSRAGPSMPTGEPRGRKTQSDYSHQGDRCVATGMGQDYIFCMPRRNLIPSAAIKAKSFARRRATA